MPKYGSYPYLVRSSTGAFALLTSGVVAALIALAMSVTGLMRPELSITVYALLLIAFSLLAMHLGSGSLRGQHRDAVRMPAA